MMKTMRKLFSVMMVVAGVLSMPAIADGLQLYYIHNDHLGTPVVVTDAEQKVVWQGEKTPFGETTEVVNTIAMPIRFPGQYYDEESGLHYNYYRDYDPGLGRYLQSDPIGLQGGINTYAYVSGNPLSRIDPFGLVELDIPGTSGETTVHANPGRDAVPDPSARAEHPPAHAHLGRDDGPRVKLTNFEPYSDADAKRMSDAQKKFCKNLTNSQKNLIRRRAKAVYKRGFFFKKSGGRVTTSSGLGGLYFMYEYYNNGGSAGLACELDPDLETCPNGEL